MKSDHIEHTPGPWTIGEINRRKQRVDIDALGGDPAKGCVRWTALARAYGADDKPEEGSAVMLANARLIAAAPDLLAALQEMLYACTDKAEAMTRAAIAKATGVEP